MPKFFVKNKQIHNNNIVIIGQDVNHIKKVLRLKVGEKIQICNSDNGKNYLCNIENINEDYIECIISKNIEKSNESNVEVTIFQGLPKVDKMEYIIQKSVELGAFDITPTDMKRCVVKITEKDKNKKIERWQKISEVAAKQCERDRIPKINNITNIKEIGEIINNYDMILIAYEKEENNSLKNELKNLKENCKEKKIKIGIVIGPEGGLEKEDVDYLKNKGAKVITLGKRILRTETVALNVLSIIMYELENEY